MFKNNYFLTLIDGWVLTVYQRKPKNRVGG